jgi:transcription elongation factor GreA
VVGPGTIVTIVYEGDDDDMAETYLLGHIEEQHDELDVISPGSPLGEALVGHRVGDLVRYQAPNGTLGVKIVQVSAA